MLATEEGNILLYVPFNQEYSVPNKLKNTLTTDEFFSKCYYEPDFDVLIAKYKKLSNEGKVKSDYHIDKEQIIENLKEQKKSKKRFENWIINDDIGIYCISGDAGAGKSTYLHALAYNSFGDCAWNFIDLQTAHTPINLMTFRIEFSNFQFLQQKLCSALIYEIVSKIFVKNSDHKYLYGDIKKKIIDLLQYYFSDIEELYPRNDIRDFFKLLKNIDENLDSKSYCDTCSSIFYEFFENLINNFLDETEVSKLLMELYLIILRYLNKGKKNIIVFDNLERFIGVDEIFNDQIYGFLSKLREIFDTYHQNFKDVGSNTSGFSRNYQFVVAMRHTTTRMFTPQQNSDFIEHMSNLSEWFPIDEILYRKVNWLRDNGFSPSYYDKLINIMSDETFNENIVRGLRLKLNGLFNNNKRLILDCLISTLEDPDYQDLFDQAECFYFNKTLPVNISKHTYRTIIWQIVIDQLLKDELFKNHFSKFNKEELLNKLDYMRKILMILSNYSLDHRYGYMNFEEFLSVLYPDKQNVLIWFMSTSCTEERKQLFALLYFMNYYCRRENNWFQFIDIQCNSKALVGIHINDSDMFYEVFTQKVDLKNVNIQITTSGKAYLEYVAHSFEFFAAIIGRNLQLFLNVPSIDDIDKRYHNELTCVKLLQNVTSTVQKTCDKIDDDLKNGYDVIYKKISKQKPLPYSDIIRHSIFGYIDVFCDYVDKLYQNENKRVQRKKNHLLKKIKQIRDTINKKG